MPAVPDAPEQPAALDLSTLTREQRDVLQAFALGWTIKPRTWVHRLLAELGARDSRDRRYTGDVVREAVKALAAAHWLAQDPVRQGYWQVASPLRSAVYLRMLDEGDPPALRAALVRALEIDESGPNRYGRFHDIDAVAAIVRLELFSGRPFAEVNRLRSLCGYATPWESVVHAALTRDLDEALLLRLEPGLQAQVVFTSLAQQNRQWTVEPLSLAAWCETHLASHADVSTFPLRIEFVQHLLWAGRSADIDAAVRPLRVDRASNAFWPAHADAAAAARLLCQPTPAHFLVPPAQEGWRMALAALAAIGGAPDAARTEATGATRLVWVIVLDRKGELFLVSLKAGGFGLNLTSADYVVIADPWWNPAAEDQASGRAHRIGQQRPVTVYRLVHSGTLEERIVALHQQKRELADSVLEGGDVAGGLKAQELVELMREAL